MTVLRLNDDDRIDLAKILAGAKYDVRSGLSGAASRILALLDDAHPAADRDSAIPVPANSPARSDQGGASASAGAAKRLLTVSQTMDVLQIGRATIYRLFNSGELRWVQIGSRRRVTAAEIDRFVAEHCSNRPPQAHGCP